MGWTISPVLIDSNLVMVYGNTAPIRRSDNLLDNNPCTWTNVTSNYHSCEIHVDMHHMTFSPDGQVLWVGNDGGVFKSQMPDLLNNWQDKCNGLAVATVYHLGISDKNRNIAMSGAFDCGVNLFTKTNGNWSAKHVVAGDGFQCIFNWRYPDTLWTSIQKTAYRSYNLGQTFHSIGGNFHFHSFFIQNKSYPNILYGTNDFGLRRSIQYGNNWHNHANFPGVTNNRTWRVANSFSNSDYIYISWIGNTQGDHQKVFKTVNGGGLNTEDWEDIGSPLEDKWINSIAIDYFNPDKIWVGAGGNVYSVNTLSKEWTNMSDGLPSYIDIKHLEILPGTSDVLFAGTNLGLFLYLEQDREWKKIAGNLPNTIVTDIHIDVYNSRIAVSTFGRGIWEADLPCFWLEETTQILSNEIWSQDRYIRGDLVIEPNVTLEIDNVYIRMNENSKIIIKPGAKLDVNGGKVTSFCNLPWQGIQVWGNKQQSQWPDQYGVLHQGMLELKNGAIIENAIDAVVLWNPGDYNSTGGIVLANDAIFRNNTKALQALMYWNFNPANPEQRMDNRSYFKNCTFELTEDYHAEEKFYKHVDLFDVFGIDFKVCNFSLHPEAENVSYYNHGIAAYSAGFSLLPVCADPNTIPCPGYLKNTFTGFNRAVSSSKALSFSPPFFVNRAAFSNNDNGVHVNEVSNFTILNSSFDVGKQDSRSECMKADGVGIYTNLSTGFAIQENNFTKYLAAPSGIYLGAWINNTQEADEVYKNYFSDLSYANYSEGKNWLQADRFKGLAYFCNQNQSNYADFYVGRDSLKSGGIQSEQGYWEHAAGNTFTQSGATWHFYNDGEHLLQYFYNQNIADQAPVSGKVYRVGLEAINYNNSCPSYYGGNDDEKPMAMNAAEQQQAEQLFIVNLNDYNNVKSLYTSLMDGGNTDGTVFDIQTAHPDDMWALRAQLLGKSPHLSMQVLKEASDRTDVFNDAALFDILAANPDELKKEELIIYLEQKEEPLPDYMVNILKQVATGTTYKTVLEQQMSLYNRNKTRAAHNMIRHIVHDSIVDNNLLRQWLNNLGGMQSDKQIIGTFVQEGNYAIALSLANMLPQLYQLQDDELMAHNAYMAMLNLQHTLHMQGRNLFQLIEAEKLQIEQLATGTGTAALQARAILEMVYHEFVEPCPCVDETGSFKNAAINVQKPAMESSLSITAKPNPARDWVVFEYRLPDESPEATIRITDAGGRLIETLTVTGKQGQKMWDIRGLEPGIYFYAIIKAGEYKSGKIVIHR